jgi:hypothetical protein
VPRWYYRCRWLAYYPLQLRVLRGWCTLGELLSILLLLAACAMAVTGRTLQMVIQIKIMPGGAPRPELAARPSAEPCRCMPSKQPVAPVAIFA